MFLSEDGELYSCGSDNLQDSTDVLYTEKLNPEKVNTTNCIVVIIFIKLYFYL